MFTVACTMNSNANPDTAMTGITRSHVAKRLGVSIATVRRMEGRQLHLSVDERGVRFLATAEVETILLKRREAPERQPNNDGEVAARVFGLLRHAATCARS